MEATATTEAVIAKMDELKGLLDGAASDNTEQSEEANKPLAFTEAEIMKMPAGVKKCFTIRGYAVRVRKRTTGRYKCSYEIRLNRGGVHISASGVTLEKAKERFLEKLSKEAN